MGIRVVAVDIGSVGPSSKFAWAAFDAPERQVMAAGTDPETAVSALVPGLLSGAQAALLLEAPMSVPVPDGQPDAWRALGKARNGEGNRPWSAGAGAAALATGLAQGAWMLRQLAVMVPAAGLALAEMLNGRGRWPPPCAARRGSHSTCWRRWHYGPGCGLTPPSCTPRPWSLPPRAAGPALMNATRKPMDALAHPGTGRIVGE